ncbi:MAG: PAS domain S-box protein [Sphingomicrobium sp.]
MRISPTSELSSAQFVAAMEHSPIGTALVGLDGHWIWTNIAIRDILGYSRDELNQMTFQQLTHADDVEADVAQAEKLISGEGSAYQMEKRYLRKDGNYVWCLLAVSLVRGEDGTPEYFISKIQDISERKAMDLERAALTERLTLATQAGRIGVWEWDIATDALLWDARMFELYGIDPASKPDYQIFLNAIDFDHRERVNALLQAAVSAASEYDTEFPILLPDGEMRQLRAMATVDRDAAGAPMRMIGTNWDVTEHRRLVMLAEQAARSKSEFLATISHELRTPLNSIIGFSRLVLDSAPPPGEAPLAPTAKRHIELVRDASSTLLTIVDDVLDYSRIEAGGFELSPAPFELRPMVENAVEIVRAGAEDKGLALTLAIDSGVPVFLNGDQSRIRQILLNLLGNAIKFTTSGHVSVDVAMANREVMWTVRDTGIGIPADKQHLLFKRFSQVDQTIARQFGGSGLGLAICERLVSAMSGSIGVESKAAVGSTFWFSAPLPAAITPASLVKLAGSGQRGHGMPRRILLAEDVEMNQLLAVALLERAGHVVTVVGNGAEALDAVQAADYDIVLMDVQMPIKDGIEATVDIRALGGRFATLPIIAVTANVMPDDIARFRAAGMSDHLGKPIPIDAFEIMLDRWCDSDAPAVANAARA